MTADFSKFTNDTPEETLTPDESTAASVDPLTQVLANAPKDETNQKGGSKKKKKSKTFSMSTYDEALQFVNELVAKHNLEHKRKPKKGETVIELTECFHDTSHVAGKAFIRVKEDGSISAGCQESDCKEAKWGFRQLFKHYEGEFPDGDAGESGSEACLSKMLVEHAQTICECFFSNQYGDACASMSLPNDHKVILKINSSRFRSLLAATFYAENEIAANDAAIRNAANILSGMTFLNGVTAPLYHRVAGHSKEIFYDLANPAGDAVCIRLDEESDGENAEIETVTPPILFESREHAEQQCVPIVPQTDEERDEALELLRKYIRLVSTGDADLDEKQFYFVVAIIISYFVPDISRPILWPHGEKGSAKTTMCRVVKKLVDPTALEVAAMRSTDQMVDQIISNHMVVFDNTTVINDDKSTLLCTAVTGGGIQKRKLYTDSEVVTHKFQRAIAVNGVNVAARNSDLFDRAILVNLARVPESERLRETEMWRTFEEEKPRILGALFYLLGEAMTLVPIVNVKLMRMTDFHLWGEGVFQALEYDEGVFTEMYKQDQRQQNTEFIESDPLANTLYAWVQKERERNFLEYDGGLTEFHQKLVDFAGVESGRLPKNPQATSRKLKTMISNFEQEKIFITQRRTSKGAFVNIQNKSGAISVTPPYP